MNRFTKLLLLTVIALGSMSCTRYDGTSTMILDDLGIQYETVDSLTQGRHGEYDYDSDTIRLVKGKATGYIALHELVHKLRKDIRQDARTEEIVAVRASYVIGKLAGIRLRMSRRDVPMYTNTALKVNGMRPIHMTDEYEQVIDEEVIKTVELLRQELINRGISLDGVDWAKTIIMILI
jgi:hypothetical protein